MTAVLIDGSAYMHRAYHSQPPMSRADGLPTGAVHGYCVMLWELKKRRQTATRFAVIFDKGRSSHRLALYPGYKGNRPPMADDLRAQYAWIRPATEAFGIPFVDSDGVEADDLIASYATAAGCNGEEIEIVSSDKDLLQLLRPGVTQWCPMKKGLLGPLDCLAKFGVMPRLAIDAQALIGDATDNVPGVPGIGPKKASALLNEFGSLDAILQNAGLIENAKIRAAIVANAELALLSRELVTLRDDIPLPVPLDDLGNRTVDIERLLAFAREMEFASFARDVAAHYGVAP